MDEKRRRGFALMDPAKRIEIATKGGRAAHEKGTAHKWDSEEARVAGRKGGLASHKGRPEAGPNPKLGRLLKEKL